MHPFNSNSFSRSLTSCTLWASLLFSTASAQASTPNQFTLQPYQPTSYWVPSLDLLAYTVLELEIKPGTSRSAAFIQSILHDNHINGVYGLYGNAQLNTTQRGLVFTTSITVGGTPYTVVVDTGSSDTWLAGKGFQCLAETTEDHLPESSCAFGPLYSPAASRTWNAIPNENFYINYSDGESLSGTYGTETVTVAGITVEGQQIAVVNNAAYIGDGVSSGLLGLAFAADTHAFSGTNTMVDSQKNQKIYNPIFTNMYTEGSVPPLFSVSLDRNGGGNLAFGGLPPVNHAQNFASSPLQILNAATPDGAIQSGSAYTLYTITTQGYSFSNINTSGSKKAKIAPSSSSTSVQMIVDTGTTFTYIPKSAADTVNNAFSPAPFYEDPTTGFYYVSCTAKPPPFGVIIGGETFYIDPRDMIVNTGAQCISGVAATATGATSVLGHSFLKNVVTVFDVGASMMRFAALTGS